MPYLNQLGVLNRFYYSHRVSTNEKTLGVPAEKLVNVWIKEYLLHAHLRLTWIPGPEVLSPLYREIWASLSLVYWSPCDLLHLMLQGGGRRLIGRSHSEGSIVIGEPVNAHPDFQNEVLNSEYARLGFRRKLERSPAQNRMLKEFELCDRFLVASNFVKRTFVEKGFDESKIDVLHYGVNLSRFSMNAREVSGAKKFRVICVAGYIQGIVKGQESNRLLPFSSLC